MADAKLRIYIEMLGGLRIRRDGEQPLDCPTHQPDALLACLALGLNHSDRREMLMEQLWPGDDADTARHKLRHCLYVLRRRFTEPPWEQPDLLLITRSTLRLDPDRVHTDVARFEELLQEALRATDLGERAELLARATAVYRGPLLPGFFQDCFVSERDRLSERYGEALRALTLAYEQAGDLEHAVKYARLAVAHDPLMEEVHGTLMRLYAAMGQPSAVVRQYQEWEQALHREFGEAPSAATRLLMEEMRQLAQMRTLA